MKKKELIAVIVAFVVGFLAGYFLGLSSGIDVCSEMALKVSHYFNVSITPEGARLILTRGL